MSWFSDIFSDGASKLVNSIDGLVTSDEERLKLRNELQAGMNKLALEMEDKAITFEQEITSRWKSDNEHTVTRLVRPLSYTAVLVLFGAIVIADGNIGGFVVNTAYIPVIETLLATMTVAYFGSRGIEKTMKNFKSKT